MEWTAAGIRRVVMTVLSIGLSYTAAYAVHEDWWGGNVLMAQAIVVSLAAFFLWVPVFVPSSDDDDDGY